MLWDVVVDNASYKRTDNNCDDTLIEKRDITPRIRHRGSYENDNRIYKITNNRKITSANISFGLRKDDVGIKDSELELNWSCT